MRNRWKSNRGATKRQPTTEPDGRKTYLTPNVDHRILVRSRQKQKTMTKFKHVSYIYNTLAKGYWCKSCEVMKLSRLCVQWNLRLLWFWHLESQEWAHVDRQTVKQTDRKTDSQSIRHIIIQSVNQTKDKHIYSQTDNRTDRQTSQSIRQTDSQSVSRSDRRTGRHTYSQSESDRQSVSQSVSQWDRQTERVQGMYSLTKVSVITELSGFSWKIRDDNRIK